MEEGGHGIWQGEASAGLDGVLILVFHQLHLETYNTQAREIQVSYPEHPARTALPGRKHWLEADGSAVGAPGWIEWKTKAWSCGSDQRSSHLTLAPGLYRCRILTRAKRQIASG